jgi:hypothetical protein
MVVALVHDLSLIFKVNCKDGKKNNVRAITERILMAMMTSPREVMPFSPFIFLVPFEKIELPRNCKLII